MFLVSLNYSRVGHLWGGHRKSSYGIWPVAGGDRHCAGTGTVLDLERNLSIACTITWGGTVSLKLRELKTLPRRRSCLFW